MGLSDDIKKAKSDLNTLKLLYEDLKGTNPFEGADPNVIAQSVEEMEKLRLAVAGAQQETRELNKSFSNLVEDFQKANNSIKQSSAGLVSMNQILSQSVKSTERLQSHQEGITTLSVKQLQQEKEKIEAAKSRLKTAGSLLQAEQNDLKAKADSGKKLSDAERSRLAKIGQALKVNNDLQGEKNQLYQDTVDGIDKEIKGAKDLRKSLGMSGALAKGMSKIPILGDLTNAGEAFENVQKKARQIQIETGKVPGRLKTAGMFAKELGKNLLTSISDPFAVLGLMIKAFKMLVSLGFAADKQITDLSKSMASSKEEAAGVRDRMVEIQNNSDNLLMTTKNQVVATLELADAFGTISGISEQQIADQVKLTKQIGLSVEEASGLQQLSLASGKSITDIEKAVIKQTSSLKKQTGVQLNNKKILGEVAKVSGQLRLMYANNPKLIAKAVIQTQKLGLSLEQAKNMSKGLLDFEQSISNELEAELLLGKDLNFETARQLALNGDVAGAAAEIAKQTGSAAEFSKMNVIQQEALAKAAGMSADELANSLVYQENLNKLGNAEKKQIQEKVDALMAEGNIAEAQRLMAAAGDEEKALAALESISSQEKFNAAMDKLKSMIGDMVAGPMAGFLDSIGKLLEDGDKMKAIFATIKGVIKGLAIAAVAFAAMNAYASLAAIPVVGVGLGIAAAASTVGYGMSLISKMNDGVVDPKGGIVMSGEKGSIQLNKDDSVVAGTDLFGGKKGGSSQKSQSQGGSDMSAVISAINTLSSNLNSIASRPINVSIDGDKIISATTDQKPNETGGAIRKNSYQVQ